MQPNFLNFALNQTIPADQPRYWSAARIARDIRDGKTSPREVCQDVIEQIRLREPTLRAWEFFDSELVLRNASVLEQKLQTRSLTPTGSLTGVPVAVKDVFNTCDMPTTMGSELWKGFTPGNDARVIHNIKVENGLVLGKTVTAEFAVHYLSADKTVNPHHPAHIPGTSSSGSAAAVAAFMAPIALGTQTAGSILRPASYCGVIGFKPTFGTIPRTGVLKTTDTLDSIGCFARTIEDIELCFEAMRVRGRDYPIVHERLRKDRIGSPSSMRVGILNELTQVTGNYQDYAQQALSQCVAKLLSAKLKLNVRSFAPPAEINEIHSLHTTIYDKTLSYYFHQESAQFDKLSDIMKELIERGNKIQSESYFNALKRQAQIRQSISKSLDDFDVIITLSTAGEAPKLGFQEVDDTCLIWTFLGFPSMSLPLFCGPNGMPFGLQLVAKRYDDYKLLAFADMILKN